MTKRKIEHETSSGNIFADLGLDDAEEQYTRSMLGVEIFRILRERDISKQKDVADLLGISKSETSQLMNANFHRFSEGRLMSFLNSLDYTVTLKITPTKAGERQQQVIHA